MEARQVINDLVEKYKKETTSQIKFLDCFIFFSACVAILQAAYCFLVGTFPFNAFLAGFYGSLGSCVISSKKNLSWIWHSSLFPYGINI